MGPSILCRLIFFLLPLWSVKADESDRVRRLRGQPVGTPVFKQYMGFVTINASRGKAFYYALMEAQERADTRPLVLWLNGGPGCSSLGNGFFLEHGPWKVRGLSAKKLDFNPFSWNKYANLVYLESPVGVGFSYSNTSSDYAANSDRQTAADNYQFLLGFLAKFPRYNGRPFYIAGESYAGYYIPELANKILTQGGNKAGINLKGVLIGNGLTDASYDFLSTFTALHDLHFLSDATYATVLRNCNDSSTGTNSNKCGAAMNAAYSAVYNLDLYNVYADSCFYNGPSLLTLRSFIRTPFGQRRVVAQPSSSSQAPPFSGSNRACASVWVYRYLNREGVRKLIHAEPFGVREWKTCSNFDYNTTTLSVLPLIQKLSSSGVRVWLFSGDMDTVVPYVGTQLAVASLHLPVLAESVLWYFYDQVGGVVTRYANLTQLTVRGAGHLVPEDQPERAAYIFKTFLSGRVLPTYQFA